MDLSIVIVNYNVRYFLEQCILSLQAASQNLTIEIIIVDNNSNDGSYELLCEKFKEVILIRNAKNVGFAKANNQAVKIAKGEFILILNPDTVVAEDTLSKIVAFAKSKQNFGVLGVKLIDGSGNFLPESKRNIPTPKASFNKLFGVTNKQTGKYYATHLAENEIGNVAILVGAFMLLKRSVYSEVNGFDEAFFMYGEDIDLSYNILQKGYKNYYYGKTKVIHYKGESTKKNIKYLRHFHTAMKLFYKKHFKLNLLYDFFMGVGIELWYWLKYLKFLCYKSIKNSTLNVLYFGYNKPVFNYLKTNYLVINNVLSGDFDKIKQIIKTKNIDTIVFDNTTTSNKTIIEHFEALKNEGVFFKIHPKTTNFLIGSFNAEAKGEIEMIAET